MNTATHTQKNSAMITTSMTVPHMAVQRKCGCGRSASLTGKCTECQNQWMAGKPVQTKLRINEPGDAYEREADRVAEQVMRMAEPNQDAGSSQLGATALVQRRIADEGGASTTKVQRQEETPEGQQASESVPQTEGGENKEEGSSCPSWRQDPESISKRAAENYVRNDMSPPSQATVEKIDCELPRDNGNYGCYVHFSDGLVIRVIVRETDIVVGTGPGPFTTLTPPPGTPLCFYDYTCPDGQLVLTKRECKSAKPSPSPGPTLVGQRRTMPGASAALDAGPAVDRVLDSAGQPLDEATRSFFAARFGHDFASVRVHADTQAAESARSIHALAYTVGSHVIFGAGQFSPGTRAGQQLLAHELTHVVQQTGRSTSSAPAAPAQRDAGATPTANIPRLVHPVHAGPIQRQPEPESKLRDLPIFLEKLELDIGQNLQDYGHHLYQAATLHADEPKVLQAEFTRYALGANVLKSGFRYAGFKADTADKLALGTGIIFKSLTFVRAGELVLDFQFDIGRGVKFETNVNLNVNPKDITDVRKAGVNFGLVRRF